MRKLVFAFISVLFLGIGAIQAQNVTITPGNNPSAVVPMGDSLVFPLTLYSSAQLSNSELEVEVPLGFELLESTPNFMTGSLTPNKLKGRILIANLQANSPLPCVVYVKPLCDARDAEPITANRKVTYSFFYPANASVPLTTKKIDNGIQNFNSPALQVTYPASKSVTLGTTELRIFKYEQSMAASHIANLKVDANCDVSGFEISKIEVSSNGTTWTEIPGIIETTPEGYTYTLTRANTFTPLGYPNNHLAHQEILFVRETVKLKSCGAGTVTYNYYPGDGTTFCTPSLGTGVVTYMQPQYAYNPFIGESSLYRPKYLSEDGHFVIRVSNNSTEVEAEMFDMYVRHYTNSGTFVLYKQAYLTNSAGDPIIVNINDTIFLNLTNDSGVPISSGTNLVRVYFDNCNNPLYAAAYTSAGLSCSDGDGVYNDVARGSTVYYKIIFNLTFASTKNECGQPALFTSTIRRGDLYYKDYCKTNYKSFVPQYNTSENTSSTNIWMQRFSVDRLDEVTVTPNPNLNVNDEAQLNFFPHSADNNDQNRITSGSWASTLIGQAANLANPEKMWVVVVLPAGMTYNPNPTVTGTVLHWGGSLSNGNWTSAGGGTISTTSTDFVYIPANSGDTLRMRVKDTNILRNHIHIPVIANAIPDADRRLTYWIEYYIDAAGTDIRRMGCPTVTVPYVQLGNSEYIGLTNFTPERRSFGYKDTAKTDGMVVHLDTAKNLGFNLNIVSSYDNVAMIGDAEVYDNITFTNGEKIFVEFAYQNSSNTKLFDIVAGQPNGINIYYLGANINVPASDMQVITPPSNCTNCTHTIRADITEYLKNYSLITGQTLKIEMNLRATGSLPTASTSISPTMRVYAVVNNITGNSPSLVGPMTIWDSRWWNLSGTSGSPTGLPTFPQSWMHYLTTSINAVHWGISWSYGAPPTLWTGGEYRPNGDEFTQIEVTYPYLMRINEVIKRESAFIVSGNTYSRDIVLDPATDYTVSHSGGSTILTITTPPSDIMTSDSQSGFGYWIKHDVINYNVTNYNFSDRVTWEYIDYPTSALPQTRKVTNYGVSIVANGGTTVYPYTYVITPEQSKATPLTNRADWTLNIVNQSNFVSTSDTLPHSWMAVECPAGVTPIELFDVLTNTVVGSNFVQYAENKYWIKLGTIKASPTKSYKLSCSYTVCSGEPELTVKYGMSKVDYPYNPDDGYSNYGSQGVLAGVASTKISFTPPVIEFSGQFSHSTNRPGNTVKFCDSIMFTASYSNGLSSIINGLQLRIDFNEPELSGYSYYSAYTPQVKFGNGAWKSVQSASTSGNILTITLDDNETLSGYGAASNADRAEVRFALNIKCGIENGMQIPAEFIGYSGCGAPTVYRVATASPIRIFGLTPPPEYWIEELSLVQKAFTGNAGEDGSMLLIGKYVQAEAATDDVLAIIDLPANLILEETHMPSISFTQNGRRLTAALPSTTTVGTEFPFNLTLKPVNPAEWTMDSAYIYIRTGKLNTLECESMFCTLTELGAISDSITVSMDKLQVRFSDDIDANSYYGSETAERVTIDGWLANDGDISAGRLTMDLMYFNGVYYEPVSNVISGLTVNSVPKGDSVQFRVVANVSHLQDVCKMALILRKDNTTSGSLNPYLSTSDTIIVPVPQYAISAYVDPICQMESGVVIGELPINDYKYKWHAISTGASLAYLNRDNIARPSFSYDYENSPDPDDKTLEYHVDIIRPNGCVSTDTILVPVKGLPSVNTVADITLCSGAPFSLTFGDATNTTLNPTTFSWIIENGPSAGLPVSGNTSTISVSEVRNTGTVPIVLQVRVTPKKNNCEGVTKYFTITINPKPRIDFINDMYYCHDDIANPVVLTGNTPNSVYKWEYVSGSGTNIFALATTGDNVLPGFIAKNTGNTTISGKYKAYAEYSNNGETCTGNAVDFEISVLPELKVTITNPDQIICSGDNISDVTFTNSVSGTVFRWTLMSGQIPGLEISGDGTFSSSSPLTNVSTNAITATYIVTPMYFDKMKNCEGNPSTFSITVNPQPHLYDVDNLTYCSGDLVPMITFSGDNSNSIIKWTKTGGSNIGLSATGGNGHMPSFTAANSGTTTLAATYDVTMEYTNRGVTCEDKKTFTITVNPKPVLNLPNTLVTTICSGSKFEYDTPASNVAGATITWDRLDNPGIDEPGATGSGPIDETLTNNTTSSVVVTYEFTLQNSGCENTQLVRVTVNPAPVLTSTLYPPAICSGVTFGYRAVSSTRNVTFSWSRAAVSGITEGASNGQGANISETLTNGTTDPITVKYAIEMRAPGSSCTTRDTVEVIVNPIPTIIPKTIEDICSGDYFDYDGEILSATDGSSFTWRRLSNTSVNEPVSNGVGTLIIERLSLKSNVTTPVNVNYIIYTEANGCRNNGDTITVKVNPLPSISVDKSALNMAAGTTDTVTATNTNSTNLIWTSSNPNVVTVSPTNMAKVVFTAVGAGTAYVKLVATNPTTLCESELSILVNVGPKNIAALSLASGYPSQICNGGTTDLSIDISGGTAPFNVTYSCQINGGTVATTTASEIQSGSRITVNPANATQTMATAVYKIVSVIDANGQPVEVLNTTVSIIIIPTPTITGTISSVTACEGSTVDIPGFSSNATVPVTGFEWTNDNPAINLSMSGVGNIPRFQAHNGQGTTIIANIQVRPLIRSGNSVCYGAEESFDITVNPKPDFSVINPAPICAGETYIFSDSDVTGVHPPISAGTTVKFYSDPDCTSEVTGAVMPLYTTTYYVKATTTEVCYSEIREIVLPVNPLPALNSETTASVCSGTRFEYTATSALSNVSYKWTRAGVSGINDGNSGSTVQGSTIRETLTNKTALPIDVVYTIDMISNGGCSASETVTVTVHPKPELTTPLTYQDICSGGTFDYNPEFNISNMSYTWTRSYINGIDESSSGGTDTIEESLTNSSYLPLTVRYSITMESDAGCTNTQEVKVKVHPKPELISTLYPTVICSGREFSYTAKSRISILDYSWERLPNSNISGTAANTGTGNVIIDTLTNTSTNAVVVEYKITMEIPGTGCSNTEIVEVIVNPTPAISLEGGLTADTICSGYFYANNITITTPYDQSASYIWKRAKVSGIAQPQGFGTTPYIYDAMLTNTTLTPLSVYYDITVEVNGCRSVPIQKEVVVNPVPDVTITNVSPMLLNVGGTQTITALSVTAVASITNWTSSNPSVVQITGTNDLQSEIKAVSQGTAVITVIVENSSGCQSTSSIIVNVGAAPTATLSLSSGSASEICNGGTSLLSVIITGGTAPYKIIYEDSDNITYYDTAYTSPHTIVVNPPLNTTNGQKQVSYNLVSVTYGSGISIGSMFGNAVITVNPVAKINAPLADTAVCQGAIVLSKSFINSSNINDEFRVTYDWTNTNPGIGLGMSGQAVVPAFYADNKIGLPTDGIISVTPKYTGTVTCAGETKSYKITVNPKPVFTVLAPMAICAGESYEFTIGDNVTGRNPSDSEVKFYLDPACVTEITSPVSPAFTTTYYVQATSQIPASCKSDAQEIVLSVKPLPELSSPKTITICSGEDFDYTATSAMSGVSYTWTRNPVSGISNPARTDIHGSTIRETLINTSTTAVDVEYIITMKSNGCDSTDIVTVTVNPKPELNNLPTAPLTTICSGDTIKYDNPSSNVSNTVIHWERFPVNGIFEGMSQGIGSISEILTNTTSNPVMVSYYFSLQSYEGCSNQQTLQVTVNPAPELSSLLYMTPICSGGTVNYTARTLSKNVSFTWERQPVTGISPVSGGAVAGNVIIETLTNETTSPLTVRYKITMTVNGLCETSEYVEIVVNPIPTISSTTTPDDICSGDNFVYYIESLPKNSNFTWIRHKNNDIVEPAATGNSSMIREILTSRDAVSSVDVEYIIISEFNGCHNSGDTIKVKVHPLPNVEIITATPVSLAVNATTTVVSSTNGTVVGWSSSNNSTVEVLQDGVDPEKAILTAKSEGIAQITLEVESGTGCRNSVTFTVNVGAENLATMTLANGSLSQICNGGSTSLQMEITGGKAPFTVTYEEDGTSNTIMVTSSNGKFSVTPPSNSGNAVETVTYKLISVTDGNGQPVTVIPSEVYVEVNPTARITNNPSDISLELCQGSNVIVAKFLTNVNASRVSYTWFNDNPDIGLPLSGSGHIPRFRAENGTGSTIVANITAIATYNGMLSCQDIDEEFTFTITIHPKPEFLVAHPVAICAGESIDLEALEGTIVHDINIPNFIADFGNINFHTSTYDMPLSSAITLNNTTSYYVRLVSGEGCKSDFKEVIVTVNPVPAVDIVSDQILCNNSSLNIQLTGSLQGAVYEWTRTDVVTGITGLAGSGTNVIYSGRLTNTTDQPLTASIVVTPKYTANGVTCGEESPDTLQITVNPTLMLDALQITGICSGESPNISLTSSTSGVGFTWERLENDMIMETPVYMITDIIDEPLTNLSQKTVNVRYIVTVDLGSCSNTQYITVPVYPSPELSSPLHAGQICSGDLFVYQGTTAVRGASITWKRLYNAGIEEAESGTYVAMPISENLTNKTPNPVTVSYAIHITTPDGGCDTIQTVEVLVGPSLSLSSPSTMGLFCSGSPVKYEAASPSTNIQYSWIRKFNANIEPPQSSGTGANIDEILHNRSSVTQNLSYVVSMRTSNGCYAEYEVTGELCAVPDITVSESEVIIGAGAVRILDVTDAHLDDASVTIGNSTIATAYLDKSTSELTVTGIKAGYTQIIYEAKSCNKECSNSVIIPVLVTDGPMATLSIAGVSTVCSEGVTQLQITDIHNGKGPWEVEVNYNGGTPVIFTVNSLMELPVVFDVNLPANAGNTYAIYTYSVTRVTDIEGSERYSHMGKPAITVIPVPEVEPINDQEICNGSNSGTVYFGGTATNYRWIVDTPVGIDMMGEGNKIPSFELSHNNSSPVTATITVTPEYTMNGLTCYGGATQFGVTVNPLPRVNPIFNQVSCNGDTINISITGDNAMEYIYTSAPLVGLATSGRVSSGTPLLFIATNPTNEAVSEEITITPVYNGISGDCYGSSVTFKVTVNPVSDVVPVQDMEFCAGVRVDTYEFTGGTPGAIYKWRRIEGDTILGLPKYGSNKLPSFIAYNTGTTAIIAKYEVLAVITNLGLTCEGLRDTFQITIHPEPVINYTIGEQSYCANTLTDMITFGNVSDITFEWKQTAGYNIGLFPNFGSDTIPPFTTYNATSYTQIAVIEVTPRIRNTVCTGTPLYFNIEVKPVAALISPIDNGFICSGDRFDYEAGSTSDRVYYKWDRPAISGINDGTSNQGQGYRIRETLTNTTDAPIRVDYIINLEFEGCESYDTITVTVNPLPEIEFRFMNYVCWNADSVTVPYTSVQNATHEYRISFTQEGHRVGFMDMNDYKLLPGEFKIPLPPTVEPGRYSVTVSTRIYSCEKDYQISIWVNDPVTILEQPESILGICEGGFDIELSVVATGDSLQYQWYFEGTAIPGATSSTYESEYDSSKEGAYYVEVSNQCETVRSETVQVKSNDVIVEMKYGSTILYVDNSAQYYVAFRWYCDGKAISKGATSQYYSHEDGLEGWYHVRCYFADGTYVESCPVYVERPLEEEFNMYPNPVVPNLKVTLNLESSNNSDKSIKSTITLIDGFGKEISKFEFTGSNVEFKAPGTPGMYNVKITTGAETISKRLIVE